jgi:ribosomal-protein-alanine N-acetyltransferase
VNIGAATIAPATRNLQLVPRTRQEVRASIEQMAPEIRKEVSTTWLELLENSAEIDPWIHGFTLVHKNSGAAVGLCAFKGPPDAAGMVEIAYAIVPEHQGKGYATEAAAALVGYAFGSDQVQVVRAHTLPLVNASTRVLAKCGFQKLGEAIDPDDGLVWRWERLA